MSKQEESIRLSPKHGLNPSVMKCFYCGGDKGSAWEHMGLPPLKEYSH